LVNAKNNQNHAIDTDANIFKLLICFPFPSNDFSWDMIKSALPWCDWLYAPQKDGKPRALRIYDTDSTNTKTTNLLEQIKKVY
jgi:hypothetical protein